MFPGIRFRTIFTSRWFALLWAVLVILTAINFVGTGDSQGDAPDTITSDQQAAVGNAF